MTEQPDLAQTVISTYALLNIEFDICGLHTLRIKETDRITALENELRKLGYVITDRDNDRMMFDNKELEDCNPGQLPSIATYKDHRMAMAFAPVAIFRPLLIEDPKVVSKSYPQYWEHLKQVGFVVTEQNIPS